MAYEVVWTENAREDFQKILEYLKKQWSLEIAENFTSMVYWKIDIIAYHPSLGVVSEKIKNKRLFITKHNALYYTVKNNTIILFDFFDTRQNPLHNKY